MSTTYSEFADSPCPWMPDQTFWEQNAGPVRDVMALVANDYPHVASTVNFDPTTMPPDAQRAALWKILMGRQHGNQEQSDGKVDIPPAREAAYLARLNEIHHGPHPMMAPVSLRQDVFYDQAELLAGTPIEDYVRLGVVLNSPNRGDNVQTIIGQTGQRLRGVWAGATGEGSVRELIETVGQLTGADMDELVAKSPFARAEMKRTGEGWFAPFATEYHIYRLVGEAMLRDRIDWKNYADVVETKPPSGPNDEIPYTDQGKSYVIPPREEDMVTYDLGDGHTVQFVNAPAVPRPQGGVPRETSTSAAEESIRHIGVPRNASLVAVTGVPHFRAGMDIAITYLDKAPDIARFDIAAAPWVREITAPVAALGELMAGMKADHRLRAVLRGGNPNTPELASI